VETRYHGVVIEGDVQDRRRTIANKMMMARKDRSADVADRLISLRPFPPQITLNAVKLTSDHT